MLAAIPATALETSPFRFQIIGDAVDAAKSMGYSESNLVAMRQFLREYGKDEDVDAYLDRPLEQKRELREQSRFSDGSFPVFYSALDLDTAKEEISYRREELGQNDPGPVYYYLIRCQFRGQIKDLRSHVDKFPYLIQKKNTGAYAGCNAIGKEARDTNLDGLRTISAQRTSGECLPVFRRPALSRPTKGSLYSFTYDGRTVQIVEHGD